MGAPAGGALLALPAPSDAESSGGSAAAHASGAAEAHDAGSDNETLSQLAGLGADGAPPSKRRKVAPLNSPGGSLTQSAQYQRDKTQKAARAHVKSMSDAMDTVESMPTINAEYNGAFEDTLVTALSNDVFHEINTRDPLPLASATNLGFDAGFKSPYDHEGYTNAIAEVGNYECGANVFWVNFFNTQDSNVPRSHVRVQNLKDVMFPHAKPTCDELVVIGVSPSDNPLEMKGAMRALSPIEILHAFVFKVADDIGNACHDDILLTHGQCSLSMTFRFVKCLTDEDRHFMAVNLRDQIVNTATELERTTCQRIFEVVDFKSKQEKKGTLMSVATLCGVYEQRAKLSKKGDAVTASFVESALSVWNRLLTIPECRQCVLSVDGKFGSLSPFNGITSLQTIVYRCKKSSYIKWVVEHIGDEVLNGIRDPKSFTVTFLRGKAKNDKGYLDILMIKYDIANALLESWHNNVDRSSMDALNRIAASPIEYRKLYGSGGNADLAWMGALTPGAIAASSLLVNILWTDSYNGTISKHMLVKTAPDIMLEEPFKGDVGAVKTAIDDFNATTRFPTFQEPAKPENAPTAPPTPPVEITLTNVWEHVSLKGPEDAPQVLADADPANKLAEFKRMARNLTQQYVFTIDAPASSGSLAHSLRNCVAGKVRGNNSATKAGYVAIVFDSKFTGETVTHPHIRIPGLRENLLPTLLGGVLQSRVAPGEVVTELDQGDVFLLFDGGPLCNVRLFSIALIILPHNF